MINYENFLIALTEITRCKGIKSVKEMSLTIKQQLPVDNSTVDVPVMRIVVYNYPDRELILKKWPKNAFGCKKITPVCAPIGINLTIIGYHNEMISDEELKYLKEMHGIAEDKKLPKSNRIKCKLMSIDSIVRAKTSGVNLNPGTIVCVPQVKLPTVCDECGENRYHKECKKLRCTDCGSIKHKKDECKSGTLHCINCHGNHSATSLGCPDYVQRLLDDNDLIAAILYGENVINRKISLK